MHASAESTLLSRRMLSPFRGFPPRSRYTSMESALDLGSFQVPHHSRHLPRTIVGPWAKYSPTITVSRSSAVVRINESMMSRRALSLGAAATTIFAFSDRNQGDRAIDARCAYDVTITAKASDV